MTEKSRSQNKMKGARPTARTIINSGYSNVCSLTWEISGNSVEEPEVGKKKSDEGSESNEGKASWTDGMLAAVLICIGVIIGIFGFLKKSIE